MPAHPPTKAVESTPYTDPALRERLKRRIQAGDRGGPAGRWSARKAQLLATEYEKHGGGYKTQKKTRQARNLDRWTAEKWRTADGKPARRGKTMARYLPDSAWAQLSPAERKSTDDKKRAEARRGAKSAANTQAARDARKRASASTKPAHAGPARPARRKSTRSRQR